MWILENQGPSLPGELGYLLLLRCLLALAQHQSLEVQLCFWNGGLMEAQSQADEYYPEQWIQMQIIMHNP